MTEFERIGKQLGKTAGEAIAATVMPVRSTVRTYAKPGKKPMPQPAYRKQASGVFDSLLYPDRPPAPKASTKGRQQPAKASGPVQVVKKINTKGGEK